MNKVIFTGFDGEDNPSRLLVERISAPCKKIVLPNDSERTAEIMTAELANNPKAVVMTGQKPSIFTKISVEPYAKSQCGRLATAVDCKDIVNWFRRNDYAAYLSSGAGNSFCNTVYAVVLQSFPRGLFLHIPTMENISDFDKLVNVFNKFLCETELFI